MLLRIESLLFKLVKVLSRVCGFILEHLHEFVETRGEKCTQNRTEPVDPMITLE